MTDLLLRSHTDYQRLPDAADAEAFLAHAVDAAYSSALIHVATALAAGVSVALYGAAGMAGPIGHWLNDNASSGQLLSLPTYTDVASALYEDERSYGRTEVAAGSRAYMVELQSRLGEARAHLVEHLDVLACSADSVSASTLLLLLRQMAASGHCLLALLPEGTQLPQSWQPLFPYQVTLPPLERSTLWQLLSYAEVKNLLVSPTLTVSLQRRLYQRVALLNVVELRQAVQAMAVWPDGPAPSPGIALERLSAWLVPERRSAADVADDIPPLNTQIAAHFVEPFRRYGRDMEKSLADQTDRALAEPVLILGDRAVGQGQIAALADALDLGIMPISGFELLSMRGAELEAITRLVNRARRAAPALLWIDAIDLAMKQDGPTPALARLLAAWNKRRSGEATYLLATAQRSLPSSMACQFIEISL